MKINKSDLLLEPYLIEIVDNDNYTISRKLEVNEKALAIAEKIFNTNPKTQVFNKQNKESVSKTLQNKVDERVYLVLDNGEYVLQTHKEFVEFYFYDDYVLLTKKINVFTAQNTAHAKTKSKSYSETYKLDYTSELRELLKNNQ